MADLRIAFLRMGPHPIPNRLLPLEIEKAFPGAVVEIFDVEAHARRDLEARLLNPFFAVGEQAANLLTRRRTPWQVYFTTTWMFRRMSAVARAFVSRGRFDLTLQIQSLFDGRVPGVPHFVYTDHTHLANLQYPDFDRNELRCARWIELERNLYREATMVFTRASNIAKSLQSSYGCEAKNVLCVAAGSNAAVPPDDAVPGERVPGNILFVGVDWERKGGPDLLRAFERISRDHPDATLTIVGCRPPVQHPRVHVVGPCPLEEIDAHYRRAEIFCLPTRREPFGVALVEAAHHGLPVVSTRIGSVPDIVLDGETGLLVEVGNQQQLESCLRELLADDGVRARMGEAGRAHVRRYFTWPRTAERIAGAIADRLELVGGVILEGEGTRS
jgi:glycosyltransferase involved in cell wall biosynthesis